ncbi:hypothetical protein V8E52_010006 [Russula decolorans]
MASAVSPESPNYCPPIGGLPENQNRGAQLVKSRERERARNESSTTTSSTKSIKGVPKLSADRAAVFGHQGFFGFGLWDLGSSHFNTSLRVYPFVHFYFRLVNFSQQRVISYSFCITGQVGVSHRIASRAELGGLPVSSISWVTQIGLVHPNITHTSKDDAMMSRESRKEMFSKDSHWALYAVEVEGCLSGQFKR